MKEKLLKAAADARAKSYSPYSHFAVGAAVLASSGVIYTGCNIENASYGLTVCAERNAIFSAICSGEKKIDALALVPDIYPCGACLQVMSEFTDNPFEFKIYIGSEENTLSDFLPKVFDLKK